jgi:predicted ATPase
MHAYLGEVDADPAERRAWGGERIQERSHGESFLAVPRHRFTDRGVYFLDELAAPPGATTIELGGWGMRRTDWPELDLVRSWREFLTAPERWLRHLFPTSDEE